MPIATSSPGRFSLALEVGREKRSGDEVILIGLSGVQFGL